MTTIDENTIINFYSNVALWCGLTCKEFNDYCSKHTSHKDVITEICDTFYLSCLGKELKAIEENPQDNQSLVDNYISFCLERYTYKEKECRPMEDTSVPKMDDIWREFFEKTSNVTNKLSFIIRNQSTQEVMNWLSLKTEKVLHFCDEEVKQKLLFNAIISLIFNMILSVKDYDKQIQCFKLLNGIIINNIKDESPSAFELYSVLKQIDINLCKSFLSGVGLSISDYDSLVTYLNMDNRDNAVEEILKLRKKESLIKSFKLILFCMEFIDARTRNTFLDWSSRFSFKKKEVMSLNALLIKNIKKDEMLSQDMISLLRKNICPKLDNNKIRRVLLQSSRNSDKSTVSQGKKGHYLPDSTRYFDKELLISTLINDGWIKLPGKVRAKTCDQDKLELNKKLNYFFNDRFEKEIEVPQDLENFELRWCEKPKGKLLYFLVRLLYNSNPKATEQNVIIKKTKDKTKAGINDKVVDYLDHSILSIVEDVFKIQVRNCKVQKKDNEAHVVSQLQKLAKAIFSCRNNNKPTEL